MIAMEIKRKVKLLIRAINKIALRVVAKACEKSALLLFILRNAPFKEKDLVVSNINPNSLHKQVAKCDGIKYKLDLKDDVQFMIYFNTMEREEISFISKVISKGSLCIDVGANVGFYALHFAKWVGKNGRVHAFEPDPNNFKLLNENCVLNNFTSIIQTHNIAFSDQSGLMPFYQTGAAHSGWGSLYEFKDIAVSRINVPTITMDDFLQSQKINQVDFLKVDVEATEFEFLEGAKYSLKTQIFKYILIEFNGPRLEERGKNIHDFVKIFSDNNYRAMGIHTDYLEKLKNGTLQQNKVMGNFLFEADGLRKKNVLAEFLKKCILCNSNKLKILDRDYNIVKCYLCGHIFNNPRPQFKDIARYYSLSNEYLFLLSDDKGRDVLFQQRLAFLARFIKKGRLLDIGAGTGQFLHFARHYFDISGIEVSEKAIDVAKEKYNINLYKGVIEETKFLPDESFDVITMVHVLEHVPYPGQTLKKCYDLLKKGGIIFIAVPNESLWSRWIIVRNGGFRKTLYKLIVHRRLDRFCKINLAENSNEEIHISHFTSNILKDALINTGFKIISDSLDPYYTTSGIHRFKDNAIFYLFLLIKMVLRINLYETTLIVAKKE